MLYQPMKGYEPMIYFIATGGYNATIFSRAMGNYRRLLDYYTLLCYLYPFF